MSPKITRSSEKSLGVAPVVELYCSAHLSWACYLYLVLTNYFVIIV